MSVEKFKYIQHPKMLFINAYNLFCYWSWWLQIERIWLTCDSLLAVKEVYFLQVFFKWHCEFYFPLFNVNLSYNLSLYSVFFFMRIFFQAILSNVIVNRILWLMTYFLFFIHFFVTILHIESVLEVQNHVQRYFWCWGTMLDHIRTKKLWVKIFTLKS